MHFPRASWLLAACMGTVINASGILEVDLVFPRNETYGPTNHFPVVFAFQNAELARYLNPKIHYLAWNLQTLDTSLTLTHDLGGNNWTEEPYLAYDFISFPSKDGLYKLSWTMTWQSCDEDAFENQNRVPKMINNMTSWATYFSIDSSAPEVDLVAATAQETCPGEYGVMMNMTDKTFKVPDYVQWSGAERNNHTCAVVAKPTSTPTPDPCRVHIDKVTSSSMEASFTARICRGIAPPDYCPKDENGATKQLAVAGVSCLLATVGALGFFLA